MEGRARGQRSRVRRGGWVERVAAGKTRVLDVEQVRGRGASGCVEGENGRTGPKEVDEGGCKEGRRGAGEKSSGEDVEAKPSLSSARFPDISLLIQQTTHLSFFVSFFFGAGFKTARMASSNTILRPFCVKAEHSRYLNEYQTESQSECCKPNPRPANPMAYLTAPISFAS